MKSGILCAVLTLAIAVAVPALAQWQEEEDGVLYIKNSERPVEEVRIELEELWRRGNEDDDILFGRVGQVVSDDGGEIYVLDTQLSEIVVFSASGEYLRTIGREGEGPGEFRDANDMYLGQGDVLGIVSVFPGKIVQLSTDDTPAGSFPLPEESGGGFQLMFQGRAVDDHVVLSGAKQKTVGGKQIQTSYLKAFDYKGNELAHYHDESHETRYGGMKFEETTFSNFSRRWTMAPDGRVAAVVDFDAYRIHVWNADGTLDRVIERPAYTPLARTAEQKELIQKLYDGITNWNPNSTFRVSETHLTVSGVVFHDDGSLWAMSSRGAWERSEGVFASYDVYDTDGHFQRRVHLLGEGDPVDDGVFFAGNRLYRVNNLLSSRLAEFGGDSAGEDDDGEPLQLIAYSLEIPDIGMR